LARYDALSQVCSKSIHSAVSGLAVLHPLLLPLPSLIDDPLTGVYAAIVGNLMAGTGLLVLFRHGSSLGGFNIVALIAQEQFGWRAGYVQMALDLCVVIGALFVVPVSSVLISALGAALLNVVLVLNHRPGRYTGY
ncbi:MAG: YitT family protein, partial [Brevibacterium yomogidense]